MTDPTHPDQSTETSGMNSRPDQSPNATSTKVDSAPNAPRDGAKSAAGEEITWERATLEKLVFATLHEQRLARRWRSFVRLSWLAFFIFIVWLGFSQAGPIRSVSTPHTAVVEIKGEIASGAEASAARARRAEVLPAGRNATRWGCCR